MGVVVVAAGGGWTTYPRVTTAGSATGGGGRVSPMGPAVSQLITVQKVFRACCGILVQETNDWLVVSSILERRKNHSRAVSLSLFFFVMFGVRFLWNKSKLFLPASIDLGFVGRPSIHQEGGGWGCNVLFIPTILGKSLTFSMIPSLVPPARQGEIPG